MKNIFIFSDITCDYPKDRYREDMDILALSLTVGEDSYDNITTFIEPVEFYNRLKAGEKVNTAMVNGYYLEEKLTERLEQGYDILYLAFSSELSGTYACAEKVVQNLKLKYPNQNLEVVDSKNASLGEGLYLDYVLNKRAQGVSYDELLAYTIGLNNHVCSYFTVMDLKHLASLGRVSKTAAFIGTIAKVMPVLYVNQLGQLIPIEKVVSRKKALKALVEKMQEKMLDAKKQEVIFIGHGNCVEDAEFVRDLIIEKFGITNIVIDFIGTVIGAHSSQGTIALFFLGKDKIESKDSNF